MLSSRPRPAAPSIPGRGFGSRPRGAAVTGRPTRPTDRSDDWTMSQRVAFLGLGIMGSRMAANLARAGYELTVWNRTRQKAESFCAEHRAELAESPAQAAAQASIVVTMVV